MSDTILSPMNLCPECQNANPEGSKFCIQCGTPLSQTLQKNSFTLSQISSSGDETKSISFNSNFDFSSSKDFSDLDSKKTKVQIKLEKGKILVTDKGSSGVYIKISPNEPTEIKPGQEFTIDGKTFRIS